MKRIFGCKEVNVGQVLIWCAITDQFNPSRGYDMMIVFEKFTTTYDTLKVKRISNTTGELISEVISPGDFDKFSIPGFGWYIL